MRKIIVICVLLISVFIITACGSSSESGADKTINEASSVADISPTSTNQQFPTPTIEIKPTATPENIVNVEEKVILENGGVVITLKSLSIDDLFGPTLDILIENNSEKDIVVQTRNSVINDVMIDALFSSEVAAGKKANDGITFMASDLQKADIKTIKNFEFSIIIIDAGSFDTIYESDTIDIPTSADPAYVQNFDDSGFVALDKNDIKIVIKKLDSEDSFWGADIYVFIENNSGKDVTIQLRDVSINGFMVEPIFSSDVLAGKKAFDTITFLESDLADNNIESIDNLEFSFHIFDTKTWNTIYDSDVIKVDFSKEN
jgi:hypothetical protein